MQIRESTKLSYLKMISEVFGAGVPVNIKTLAATYKVDAKLPTWLLENGYFTKVGLPPDMVKPVSISSEIYDTLLSQFINYRNELNAKTEEKKKAMVFYEANKGKVDPSTNTLSEAAIKEIEKQVEERIIAQVVEYAEIAIKLKKQDIAGFIKHCLTSK